MGGNPKQEARASSPSQAYPGPASPLHLHGSHSGACVRTICTNPRPRVPPSLPFVTHS